MWCAAWCVVPCCVVLLGGVSLARSLHPPVTESPSPHRDVPAGEDRYPARPRPSGHRRRSQFWPVSHEALSTAEELQYPGGFQRKRQ